MISTRSHSKLIEKLSSGQTSLKNGPKMHDTPLSSLSLRLHEPYWFVHEGDCEHFLEFNQIRYVQVYASYHCAHPIGFQSSTSWRSSYGLSSYTTNYAASSQYLPRMHKSTCCLFNRWRYTAWGEPVCAVRTLLEEHGPTEWSK